MKKSTFLSVIVILGLLFILLQYIIFIMWKKQEVNLENEIDVGKWNLEDFATLELFQDICTDHGIRVFVIEPGVLKEIFKQSSMQNLEKCIFCREQITYGVFHDDHLKSVIEQISKSGFSASLQYDDYQHIDEENLQNKALTHVFLILQHDHLRLLHLLIFYERSGGFVWHSAARWTPTFGVDISFARYAGAYRKFKAKQMKINGCKFNVPDDIGAFLTQISQSAFIECNYTQAHLFQSRYQEEVSQESSRFKRKARQMLSRAKHILDAFHIRFWLSSGTCLGWYRQCDIITYSKDVDIGIWIKDYKEELVPAFEQNGFHLKHIFGKVSDSYELSFEAGDIKLDMFFFYEEDTYMWNGGTQAKSGKKYKYYFPKFTLCWTEFLGMNVRIPCDTESYIEANYGKNWFTPIKDWDWKSSPTNVKENGIWPAEELDTVIQVFQIENEEL